MSARSWASLLATTAVAGIAAIASYSHMRTVALDYGQSPLIATLLPFSVDGLVLVGAVAIGDGREHTWSAWAAFWTGVGASIAANVLAAQPNPVARIISAWPALALLLAVEVITRSGKQRSTPDAAEERTWGETQHPGVLRHDLEVAPAAESEPDPEPVTAPAAPPQQPPAAQREEPVRRSTPDAAEERSAADDTVIQITRSAAGDRLSDDQITAALRRAARPPASQRDALRLVAAAHPGAAVPGPRRIARILQELGVAV